MLEQCEMMQTRRIVSLVLLVLFLLSSISGLMLFISDLVYPPGEGRRQGGQERAKRALISAVHTWSSIAMTIVSVAHIWFNRRALARYLGLSRGLQ